MANLNTNKKELIDALKTLHSKLKGFSKHTVSSWSISRLMADLDHYITETEHELSDDNDDLDEIDSFED